VKINKFFLILTVSLYSLTTYAPILSINQKKLENLAKIVMEKASDVTQDIEKLNAKLADQLSVSPTTAGVGVGLASLAFFNPYPLVSYLGVKAYSFFQEDETVENS
jgi:hypothetical protein